ncbi:hypothetical protein B0H17DRAFT_1212532 [Mycena rosella]|uniref:Uncharacterized protein n=1 Tax=Mycena rosella TaxID=1033263 RepID=A0AAD7CS31_MYCRO|nr:hypothetical protein B0H17DRAFT_1212532 [Mycena rosella]
MSASSSFSSARRLALHPSAQSDAEDALTASLADLADTTGDPEYVSVSVREARAGLCGRHAALGSGTVGQVQSKSCASSPPQRRSAAAPFAALQLVLHTQAGRGVDRGLAFVQVPVPAAPIQAPGHSAL